MGRAIGAIGSGLSAGYHDEALPDTRRFRGRFQVVDQATGEPVSGIETRIRSTGGQYHTGVTDPDGFTEWIERDAMEALAFDLVQQKP